MKIVHLCTYINGGAGQAAWRLHEALLASGIDSKFISIQQPPGLPDNQGIKWKFYPPPLEFKIRQRLNLGDKITRAYVRKAWDRIKNYVDSDYSSLPFVSTHVWNHPLVKEADIVHLHWVSEMVDYIDFFPRVKKPIVWTLHDMQPFLGLFHYENDSEINSKLAGTLDNYILQIKKKVINNKGNNLQVVAPSIWMKKKAQASEVFERLSIALIPYSLNTTVFFPHHKLETRIKLALPTQRPILLFVSEITGKPRKGFDLLVEGLQLSKREDFFVVAIGDHNNIESIGVDHLYTGKVNDHGVMAQYYSAADAVIIPSREDNLPNVMLESLACGTPVIGFAVGGLVDHVHYRQTGVLAQSITAPSLGDAIDDFFNNRNEYKTDEIRAYAVEKFSPHRQAKDYITIYQQMQDNCGIE